MFILLSLLISYALLTFGAVLPNSVFLLSIVWALAAAGYLINAAVRRSRFEPLHAVLFILFVLILALVPTKLAVALCAGIWAAVAARGDEQKTLRFLRLLLIVAVLE